jgi:predicted enzyme related to lactoylglutathione lyase
MTSLNTSTKQKNKTQNAAPAPTTDVNGTFAWFELRAKDPRTALAFLTDVIGFKSEAMPMGPSTYTMLVGDNGPVGGVIAADGKTPGFISYLSVDDVTTAARRVQDAGGKLLGSAFDVPTVGRMQPITDSNGAELFLFKAEKPGARVTGRLSFDWNELHASDEDKALAFYTGVFGYAVDSMPIPSPNGASLTYRVLKAKSGPAGGLMQRQGDIATQWVPYVAVDDVDAVCTRVTRQRGAVVLAPTTMAEVGRIAMIATPEGALIGLVKPTR